MALHLAYSYRAGGDVVRYGYTSELRLGGPGRPPGAHVCDPNDVHVYPVNAEGDGTCSACKAGTCIQRIEAREGSHLLIIHDTRGELAPVVDVAGCLAAVGPRLAIEARLWRLVHNLVAHPLMELLPARWGTWVHDATASRAFLEE